ncbi:hypothetical protein GCM10010486_03830 [Nonomuraea roseoviolacea subsp. carminata]
MADTGVTATTGNPSASATSIARPDRNDVRERAELTMVSPGDVTRDASMRGRRPPRRERFRAAGLRPPTATMWG